jgi:hypothetical protein
VIAIYLTIPGWEVEMAEIFKSALRSHRDLAGVFEYDGETAYFYLYRNKDDQPGEIIEWIHIFSGSVDFEEQDISIVWDQKEETVGLFIRGQLWAAFSEPWPTKHGGNYAPGAPSPVLLRFNR